MEDTTSTRARSTSIMINKTELELLLRNLGLKGAYCREDDSHSCPDARTSPAAMDANETRPFCNAHERIRRTESSDSVRQTLSRRSSIRVVFPTLERLPTVMQQTEAKLFPERRSRANNSCHPLMRVTTPTDDFLHRLDARQERLLKHSISDAPVELKNVTPSLGKGLLDEYDASFRSRAATNPEKVRQKRQPQDTVFDIVGDGQHLPVLNGRCRGLSYTKKRELAIDSILSQKLSPTGNESDRSADSIFSSSVDDERLRSLKLD